MFVYNSVSKKKANHCIDICYVISFYPAKISFEQLFVVHYFSEVPWLMIINILLMTYATIILLIFSTRLPLMGCPLMS